MTVSTIEISEESWLAAGRQLEEIPEQFHSVELVEVLKHLNELIGPNWNSDDYIYHNAWTAIQAGQYETAQGYIKAEGIAVMPEEKEILHSLFVDLMNLTKQPETINDLINESITNAALTSDEESPSGHKPLTINVHFNNDAKPESYTPPKLEKSEESWWSLSWLFGSTQPSEKDIAAKPKPPIEEEYHTFKISEELNFEITVSETTRLAAEEEFKQISGYSLEQEHDAYQAILLMHDIAGENWTQDYPNVWDSIKKGDFKSALDIFGKESMKDVPDIKQRALNEVFMSIILEEFKDQLTIPERVKKLGKDFKDAITPKNNDDNYTEEHRQKLIAHLKLREGYKLKVYKDSVGKPTVGIGHLITSKDRYRGKRLKVGDRVSEEYVMKLFDQDTVKAIKAAKVQMASFGINDPDFRNTLTSVNFQLGGSWGKEHVQTASLIKQGRYIEAAAEAANSLWAQQTPIRVADFQKGLIEFHQRELLRNTPAPIPTQRPNRQEDTPDEIPITSINQQTPTSPFG